MRVSATVVALTAATANAATIRVDVGKSGLTFSPSSITAAKGDILDFHFFAINHSVVAGDFNVPCQPALTGGFFSGFVPVSGQGEGAKTFQVTVNSTDPTVFYCAQNVGSHCASGMAAVVNPAGSQTLEAYVAAAKSAGAASVPAGGPFGGAFASGSGTPSGTAAGGATPSCTPGSSGGSSGYRLKRATACGNAAGNLKAPAMAAGGLVALVGVAALL